MGMVVLLLLLVSPFAKRESFLLLFLVFEVLLFLVSTRCCCCCCFATHAVSIFRDRMSRRGSFRINSKKGREWFNIDDDDDDEDDDELPQPKQLMTISPTLRNEKWILTGP